MNARKVKRVIRVTLKAFVIPFSLTASILLSLVHLGIMGAEWLEDDEHTSFKLTFEDLGNEWHKIIHWHIR